MEEEQEIAGEIGEIAPGSWVYIRSGNGTGAQGKVDYVDWVRERVLVDRGEGRAGGLGWFHIKDCHFVDKHTQNPLGKMPDGKLSRSATLALSSEVARARRKFPGNKKMLAALMEEVGELSRALLEEQGSTRVRAEALQVAVVAMRVVEEGDGDYPWSEPSEPLRP